MPFFGELNVLKRFAAFNYLNQRAFSEIKELFSRNELILSLKIKYVKSHFVKKHL